MRIVLASSGLEVGRSRAAQCLKSKEWGIVSRGWGGHPCQVLCKLKTADESPVLNIYSLPMLLKNAYFTVFHKREYFSFIQCLLISKINGFDRYNKVS